MLISNAYAQAVGGGIENSLMNFLPLILMFGVLWLVMIRPQMKRQKEHKVMLDALGKGDEVITGGGILAKVTKVGEQFVSVEIANGVEIQVQKPAIHSVLPKGTIKAL
jgi:preprotein translocase subunit YajC